MKGLMVRRTRRSLAPVALFILTAIVTANPSHALCVFPSPDALERAITGKDRGFYDVAFIGIVDRIRPAEMGLVGLADPPERGVRTPIDLRVEATLHGRLGRAVTVANPGGQLPGQAVSMSVEDTFGFEVGQRYVVIAHQISDGTLTTNACTPTKAIGSDEARRLARIAGAHWTPLGAVDDEPRAPSPTSRSWLHVAGAAALVFGLAVVLFLRLRRRAEG